MRRAIGGILPLAAVTIAVGCSDFVSSYKEAPMLHGSYTVIGASEVGPSDRFARGWQIGINLLQGLPDQYIIVQLAPEGEFADAIVTTGTFRTELERTIVFYDEDGVRVDQGEFFDIENRGLRLELEGGLGFRELVTASWSFSRYPFLSGVWEPSEFRLVDADGESVDLAQLPGVNVSMYLDTYWGTHQMHIEVPAGVLGDSIVNHTYSGRFNTVGTSVVFHQALGCGVFAGEARLQIEIEFRGFACDVGGKPYLLTARFSR